MTNCLCVAWKQNEVCCQGEVGQKKNRSDSPREQHSRAEEKESKKKKSGCFLTVILFLVTPQASAI